MARDRLMAEVESVEIAERDHRAAQGGGFAIEVAQLSETYGPGPSVRRNIHV